jgi:hypothetical protein
MKKVLENRSLEDEKRMAQLEDAKKTTFKIVFTTIFSAGCDSCGRQRADEEGAGEPEPGGREAYGAAGGAAQGGAQPRRGGRPQIRRGDARVMA